MKPLILLLALFLLIPGCAQQKSSPIEGAWKLVYATYTQDDTLRGEFPGNLAGSDMKMWTKGHFMFVGRYKQDTTSTDNYGGGTYTLEGDQYQENIQYHSHAAYVGQSARMVMEIRNDTLIQTWPLRANGQIDKSNFRQEKYVRLD